MKNGFIFIEAVIVVAIIATLAFVVIAKSHTCENQAMVMGMRHTWGIMQGCMIEYKQGKWVPLKNYRANEPR